MFKKGSTMNFKMKHIALVMALMPLNQAFAGEVESRIEALEAKFSQLEQQRVQDVQQVQQLQETAQKETKKPSVYSDTDIKFYGIVRVDGAIDFKDTASPQFVSGQIPSVDYTPAGNRSAFTITATRLGMDMAKKIKGTDVKAKIEMDFWDGLEGNGKLRLRHAYVDFDNWLIGQTVSNMSNLETLTESVDYTLFMGYSWTRLPQVRYNFNLAPAHNIKVAAEYVDTRASEIPAVTAKYVYNKDDLTLVTQGFAHEKRATLKVDGQEKDIDKWGWGVGLGFKYKLSPVNSIQAHMYHVEGDQKFVSYTQQSGGTLNGYSSGGDFSVNAEQNDLDQNKVNTYVLGYSHKLSEQWRTNFAASLIDFDSSTSYARNNPTMNKQLSDIAANIFYTPVQNVDVGLEYHHGERKQFDGKSFDISRVNFVTTYKF